MEDIEFRGKIDAAYIMQLNCHSCQTPVIATVLAVSSAKHKNYQKYKGKISTNDLIELHEILKNHKGDLKSLLKK